MKKQFESTLIMLFRKEKWKEKTTRKKYILLDVKNVDSMKYMDKCSLFGNEKDKSFKGSIKAIYQSFDREDMYATLEEKVANLLYFVIKNHSLSYGYKRIAATIFFHFLDKNGA